MTADTPDDRKGRYVYLGKYEVQEHIASGGMGAVYKARDPESGRVVALKILPSDIASQPGKLERFLNEARQGMRLSHPNIARLEDFGEANGTHFLVLEYVEGTDLYRYIEQQGRVDPKESCRIVLQAARALDHIHQHGLVHRDIKPANLLLTQERGRLTVKLTDLGLARETSDEENRLTRDGITVGTVDYMAPEQARSSRAADIRSDIYALGCTWYHMLTGQPPFPEGTMIERLYKHLEAAPTAVYQLNPAVPNSVVAILDRMLAKDPAARYQTPAELIEALQRLKKKKDGQAAAPSSEPDLPPEITAPAPEPDLPPPVARKKKRQSPMATPPEFPGLKDPSSSTQDILSVDDPSQLPALSVEQQQAAAGQFERAREVLVDGNFDYAIHLLLSSCKLDPTNLVYRQTLRRTEKKKYGDRGRGRRFSWLSTLPARTKLKSAKRNQQHLKVLEHGEEVLTHDPWDLSAQMDMAEAAQALDLIHLATWILEEARDKHDQDKEVFRALALIYEKRGKFAPAIAQWEEVRRIDPTDFEAHQKITNLAARETIVRLKGQ